MASGLYASVLEALYDTADPLLIVCHISPDGDAIGAALAVAHYCDSIGRSCTLVNDDPIPSRYDFLPGADRFVLTDSLSGPFSAVVALDCADSRRMGKSRGLFATDAKLINIDHHETNNGFGSLNLVQPEAAATCLVLYRLFRAGDTAISKSIALALYTGIVFDTGGFRYNNTTPEIHLAAADLLSRDIEPFLVADRVLEAMTREQAELVRLGLATLTVHDSGRIAYVAVDQTMLAASGAAEGDIDVLLPYTRSLSGIEVGLLFRERADGSIKVSLRSREFVDVSSIAMHFGGGGHVRAAGCEHEGPLAAAIADLVSRVERAVDEAFATHGQRHSHLK